MNYKQFIQKNKDIIGVIHVKAMPGTPSNRFTPQEIINKAVSEAKIYRQAGLKTVMIENMHDTPYVKEVGPEIVSLMAVIGNEIKKLGLFCGIQILADSNKEALAAAHAANLDFIRCEGFVFAHVADEGLFESCAGELLRYRKTIRAEDILIFTDIKKKHSSHAITMDINLLDTAYAAEFFLSDGIIITGKSTGSEPDINDLKLLEKMRTKKIIGSGINENNLEKYFSLADIFIIGSAFKKDGYWANELGPERIKRIMERFNQLNQK